jgi:hypothetical protein
MEEFYLMQEAKETENICKKIQKQAERNRYEIERLKGRIKELEDEHWKDNELQSMKKQYDEMKEDYYRGFPISKEEKERINAWVKKHEKEKHLHSENDFPRGGAIGGSYTYYFTPTSIGVFGTIKCSCGEKFDFQQEA